MAEAPTVEIERAAEEALRKASGNWNEATQLFRYQLDESQELREALLERSLSQELRAAAVRLGVSSVPCPFCGEEVALDSPRCRLCGEVLGEEPVSSAPVAPAKALQGGPIIRHFTLLTGWILIVLMVILIITFAT